MNESNQTKRDLRTGSHLVAAAIAQEMERDDDIIVFGEDVAALGGVFGATRRLERTFGSQRVFDTPISETAFIGMATGAAQAGLRPIVELMFIDFVGVCYDQVINQMAKNTYMSGGVVSVPLVVRGAVGCIGSAAQHSQVLSAVFAHIPGLKVVFPGTPGDLQSMLVKAIRDPDPVIFLEHKRLLQTRLEVLPLNDVSTDEEAAVGPSDFGKVERRREGKEIVIVTAGWMVQEAFRAAESLAKEAGIEVGIVDIRSLIPLDREGLFREIREAGHVLIVDEDYHSYGMAAEIMASLVETGETLPPITRHALEVPIPASKPLEEKVVPSANTIRSIVHGIAEG